MIESRHHVVCDICFTPVKQGGFYPDPDTAMQIAVEFGWQTRLTHDKDLCPYCQDNCV